MKWVVYGVVDTGRAAETTLPAGLQGAGLFAVEHGQIAALLSPLSDDQARSAGIDQALEYAGIVEALHRKTTIVPMRYGCFVLRPEQAAEFLRRYEREFVEALAAIEGCDEMGVRALLPRAEPNPSPAPSREEHAPDAPGAGYLSSRRRFYDERARAERACSEWADRARETFFGLSRHESWECAVRPEGVLLSLSFLVEKGDVPAFMDAFHRFQGARAIGAICSGPWPPYVFVAGLARPDAAEQAEMQFLHR